VTLRQPAVVVAMLAAAVGYGVMNLLMSRRSSSAA
jgi:hypothetical protein